MQLLRWTVYVVRWLVFVPLVVGGPALVVECFAAPALAKATLATLFTVRQAGPGHFEIMGLSCDWFVPVAVLVLALLFFPGKRPRRPAKPTLWGRLADLPPAASYSTAATASTPSPAAAIAGAAETTTFFASDTQIAGDDTVPDGFAPYSEEPYWDESPTRPYVDDASDPAAGYTVPPGYSSSRGFDPVGLWQQILDTAPSEAPAAPAAIPSPRQPDQPPHVFVTFTAPAGPEPANWDPAAPGSDRWEAWADYRQPVPA